MQSYFCKNKARILAALFFLLIVILALGFHRQVRIMDVLAEKPADGFSVHISIWRYTLEPVVGPLLFYLRANQPVEEFLMLMLWTIIGLFIILQARQRGQNGLSIARRFLASTLQWLAYIPIVIIIWVGLILILIYAPLPSNTIDKHDEDAVLVNAHSHTYYSHDGLISPAKLMRWHKRNGFDAFFITDHNNHAKTLESVAKQRAGTLPPEPLIICGEEFSGSNHILLLGLTRDFKTRNMADSTAIDSAHAQNGVAVIAHWFADKHKTIQHYIDLGADGFEIVNQAEGIRYDQQAIRAIIEHCRMNNLIMLGDCDYHGYGTAALTWNALDIPGWQQLNAEEKTQAIMDIFRGHQQNKIRVLKYDDRTARSEIVWSPVYTLVDYFRTLNVAQIISWLFWLIVLQFVQKVRFIRTMTEWFRAKKYRLASILGTLSSLYVFASGLVLILRAPALMGYNEIFMEYGKYFSIGGFLFLLYSTALLLFKGLQSSKKW